MNCKHPSFDVNEHDYCPDCGETDVHKIIDERHIATLEAEIESLNKSLLIHMEGYLDAQTEIERLKEIGKMLMYYIETGDMRELDLNKARAALGDYRG
jgi:hypothetical protein